MTPLGIQPTIIRLAVQWLIIYIYFYFLQPFQSSTDRVSQKKPAMFICMSFEFHKFHQTIFQHHTRRFIRQLKLTLEFFITINNSDEAICQSCCKIIRNSLVSYVSSNRKSYQNDGCRNSGLYQSIFILLFLQQSETPCNVSVSESNTHAHRLAAACQQIQYRLLTIF